MKPREILFRGKRCSDGQWVYGSYINAAYSWHKYGRHEDWIACGAAANGGWFALHNRYPVIHETVGQFTGLTDKNGKKIFEGDIVATDLKRPYLIVEYRDGCFMFNCNDGGKDYYDIMLPILNDPQMQYEYGEVIGNIYDNRDLLEKTNI